MNLFKKILSLFTLSVISGVFASAALGHEGKLVKVQGTVQVQLPGQPAVPATLGMMIPQGTIITTGADGQVFLETFDGGVATINKSSIVNVEKLDVVKQGDQVVSQEAMLDLKRGNIVSTLDPAKKNINKYGVKTPKGVAAARGTVLGVEVNSLGGSTVYALTGTVVVTSTLGTFTLPVGGGSPLFLAIDAPAGTAPTPLSEAVANDPTGALGREILEAVQVVAANVASSNTSVGGNAANGTSDQKATAANTATSVMTAVVKAAANAIPDKVAEIAQSAVAAVSDSKSQTKDSSNAVAAITEALVSANPAKVAEISAAAATAVVDTKVTQAVQAAKDKAVTEGKPEPSKDDLSKIAQDTADAAKTQVQTIAQTAFNTALGDAVKGATDNDDKAAKAGVLASLVSASTTKGSDVGATTAAKTTGVESAGADATVKGPDAVVTAPANPAALQSAIQTSVTYTPESKTSQEQDSQTPKEAKEKKEGEDETPTDGPPPKEPVRATPESVPVVIPTPDVTTKSPQ